MTDAQRERLEPLLPVSNGRCGRWRDHRQVVNGVLYRIRTGMRWRDRPERQLIQENPEKIPADAKGETETALADLEEKLKGESAEGDNTAAIRQAMERAAEAAQKVGAALYERSGAERGTSAGTTSASSSGGTGSEDEAVDAETVDDKGEAG
ncbi:transposase [Streptomyces sp. IMTB 2501]|uniref:transposase n=1 Tax=Streptomyces sp. IMTB 2501 TaxID=1776340 RepID=UPI000D19BFEB